MEEAKMNAAARITANAAVASSPSRLPYKGPVGAPTGRAHHGRAGSGSRAANRKNNGGTNPAAAPLNEGFCAL